MNAALLALLASSPAHADDGWWFLPEQASTFAADVDAIFNFINVLNLAFFVVMMGARHAVIVFQARNIEAQESARPDPGQSTGIVVGFAVAVFQTTG